MEHSVTTDKLQRTKSQRCGSPAITFTTGKKITTHSTGITLSKKARLMETAEFSAKFL